MYYRMSHKELSPNETPFDIPLVDHSKNKGQDNHCNKQNGHII